MNSQPDLFTTAEGKPRVLRGVAIASGSTRIAEMAARLGFDAIWIEMEHGPADFNQVEQLCVAIDAGGGIPVVRIPDGQRHHVLRALEVGARIVVVPMVDTPAEARKVVEYGKFPPLGSRGFNLRSRGLGYGLEGCPSGFASANASTHLFVQVESRQAVENLRAICEVEGICGILIGPGDLSSNLSRPGDFKDPEIIHIVAQCVRTAREYKRHAGIMVGQGPMLDAAVAAGADLLFVGSEMGELAVQWAQLLTALKSIANR
jgi:2-keto-3-deoxy-L-rhamnonate aldolase RhmA